MIVKWTFLTKLSTPACSLKSSLSRCVILFVSTAGILILYAVQNTRRLSGTAIKQFFSQKSLHKMRWSSRSQTFGRIQLGIWANFTFNIPWNECWHLVLKPQIHLLPHKRIIIKWSGDVIIATTGNTSLFCNYRTKHTDLYRLETFLAFHGSVGGLKLCLGF